MRFSSSPEFFGKAKTNTALIEYVPRTLTRTTLEEEMRERHEERARPGPACSRLVRRAREASVVDACRRVSRDEGTSEGACEHIVTKKIDHTIKDCGDDGRYAESSATAWNRLQGFLPEDLSHRWLHPSETESKVVKGAVREAVGLPAGRFAGDPSGDPAVVGRCLGLMHRCAS